MKNFPEMDGVKRTAAVGLGRGGTGTAAGRALARRPSRPRFFTGRRDCGSVGGAAKSPRPLAVDAGSGMEAGE